MKCIGLVEHHSVWKEKLWSGRFTEKEPEADQHAVKRDIEDNLDVRVLETERLMPVDSLWASRTMRTMFRKEPAT